MHLFDDDNANALVHGLAAALFATTPAVLSYLTVLSPVAPYLPVDQMALQMVSAVAVLYAAILAVLAVLFYLGRVPTGVDDPFRPDRV